MNNNTLTKMLIILLETFRRYQATFSIYKEQQEKYKLKYIYINSYYRKEYLPKITKINIKITKINTKNKMKPIHIHPYTHTTNTHTT